MCYGSVSQNKKIVDNYSHNVDNYVDNVDNLTQIVDKLR